ncbi:MAG: (2Fe-2S)-binding protein [Luminiphilus sp.]|nr:(2Fe-2S)-binding protein [Luminiphilus sp.]MDG2038812.1 (2Fe-2S)-binding protein [Luminiphilus sp.]
MYICICKGVTESAIREQVCAGARSVDEVSRRTGCSTQCGKCLLRAKRVVQEARQSLEGYAVSEPLPA